MKMNKTYEAPELKITSAEDIITASSGDTPKVDVEW